VLITPRSRYRNPPVPPFYHEEVMSEVTSNPNEFVWVQKYRPKSIDECILPEELKTTFKGIAQSNRIPTMLLSGNAGVGKTTVAIALCETVGADWLLVNGSIDNGIDVLRTRIASFASTMSFYDAKKVVILDEADYLNANSVQPALRGFIEEFSKNCTFIFTCNYRNRIIEPLQSRCAVYEFKIPNSEKPKLATQFMKRVSLILDMENIEYDKRVVAELIQKHFPDYRRVLNELQRYSSSGKIDTGILVNLSEDNLNKLVTALKERKFRDVRHWVAHNLDVDSVKLFSDLYSKVSEQMEPKAVPDLVTILAKYQFQAAFVADQEINSVAALTEIMMTCSWK